MNGTWKAMSEKSPMITAVLAIAMSLFAWMDSRSLKPLVLDRYTSSTASGVNAGFDKRISLLEQKLILTDTEVARIAALKVPRGWFENRVNSLDKQIQELKIQLNEIYRESRYKEKMPTRFPREGK